MEDSTVKENEKNADEINESEKELPSKRKENPVEEELDAKKLKDDVEGKKDDLKHDKEAEVGATSKKMEESTSIQSQPVVVEQ